jgi:hypothetical protein
MPVGALKKSPTRRHGDTEEKKKLFPLVALCGGIEEEPHTEIRRYRGGDSSPCLCVSVWEITDDITGVGQEALAHHGRFDYAQRPSDGGYAPLDKKSLARRHGDPEEKRGREEIIPLCVRIR